jgi:uncharacterized membrane protein
VGISKDIDELLSKGVISQESAERIREHYQVRSEHSGNRLVVVFGILGSILVGLGITLIISHNWDDFPKLVRLFFAFLPLIAGQVVCGYTLIKLPQNKTLRESASAFLLFAIGACIALVAQIYHIPGDIAGFLLTWMLLALPLVYLMRSSVTSLLYIGGILWFGVIPRNWNNGADPALYWLLLAGILPYYFHLIKQEPLSNPTQFHHWMIPASLIICLGTTDRSAGGLLSVAYFSLFGCLYLLGDTKKMQDVRRNNSYKVMGSLGTIILLLYYSFDNFWPGLLHSGVVWHNIGPTDLTASVLLSIMAGILLFMAKKERSWGNLRPVTLVFILFIFTWVIGHYSKISPLLINVFVFYIGIVTLRDGARQNHLGILNYGLLVITALVICRFFDTDLSFGLRGILFLLVGAGFFVANYMMVKKRRAGA